MKAHYFQNNDLLEIANDPYIVVNADSKFGRTRGHAQVKVIRTSEFYTLGFSNTSWDKCPDVSGHDSSMWKAKKLEIKLGDQTVVGMPKQVIYVSPHIEPQRP